MGSEMCIRDRVKAGTDHFVFYQEAMQYWTKSAIGLPYYAKNGKVGAPAHGRYLYCKNASTAAVIHALINSSLFYAYFVTFSDCFHLGDKLVRSFPISEKIQRDKTLVALGEKLQKELKKNSSKKMINTKAGDKIEYAEFFASESKTTLDEVDSVLAKHFKLNSAETDFVQSFDAKYRCGIEAEQ